ncbi:hypothetical protein LDENG_00160450 [Lucifuga dentata]|nr:hypothetical protein LDENG_00160450 [Lucifuga dentata]
MSSANIIVQGDSCLTSSVSLSITTANKKGLRADPWCSPTSTCFKLLSPIYFLRYLNFSCFIPHFSSLHCLTNK